MERTPSPPRRPSPSPPLARAPLGLWERSLPALAVTGTLLLGGCDTGTTPITQDPDDSDLGLSLPAFGQTAPTAAPRHTLDDRFAALSDEIPGFAGLYFEVGDQLVV